MNPTDERKPAGPVFYLAAAAAPLLFGVHALFYPFGRDQGIHATIAAALRDGHAVYRDVYNIKPPLTTAVHWLALELFGHNVHAIRALDVLLVMGCAALLAGIVLRLRQSRGGALGAAVGLPVIYYAQGYWYTAQTDTWAAFAVVAALWLLASAWRRGSGASRAALIFGAGLLMGVAFGLKYTVAAAGLVIFAPALCNTSEARFYRTDLLAFVAGGAVFVALLVSLLAVTGVMSAFVEIQLYLGGYVAGGSTSPVLFLLRPLDILIQAESASVLVIVGAALVVRGLFARRASLFAVATLLVLLGFWMSGAAQGKAIPYHFGPMIIAYALFFGVAVDFMLRAVRQRTGVMRYALATGLALIVLATPGFKRNLSLAVDVGRGTTLRAQWAKYPGDRDFSFVETLAFSDVLTGYRAARAPFFVWGYETTLYFLQDASPAYRYPYAWPFAVTYYDGRYTDDLLGRLRQAPPAHVVVQKGDATPMVTGRNLDSWAILALHPKIEAFLTGRYAKVEDTPRFELWQRTDD
ncbi:MAG: glycosyltransferase family 39 protein [Alphaproteobacteria bacterium]